MEESQFELEAIVTFTKSQFKKLNSGESSALKIYHPIR